MVMRQKEKKTTRDTLKTTHNNNNNKQNKEREREREGGRLKEKIIC